MDVQKKRSRMCKMLLMTFLCIGLYIYMSGVSALPLTPSRGQIYATKEEYELLPYHYQFLLVTAVVIITVVEGLRLYLGYIGNLQEKVPELAGFLLLSFLIQLPILLFLLTDQEILLLPLEIAVHAVYLLFLTSELVAAFFTLKTMTKHLAIQFQLRQLDDHGNVSSVEALSSGDHHLLGEWRRTACIQ